jgi:peroxiredoxin
MLRALLQYFSKLFGKTSMPLLSAGITVPYFQVATTTGERLSLQEALTHGPVLLAFFKVSCPTCQFTFPFLQRLFAQMQEQGVQIWAINYLTRPHKRVKIGCQHGIHPSRGVEP